jgi:uncharacterized radical SAM protein YgiQ
MYRSFYAESESGSHGMMQQHGDRYLVHNPPAATLNTAVLDEVYGMEFERDVHPFYKTGEIRALETIKQSITAHRGCFGQCSFCAIAVHQGRKVISRSPRSILEEVRKLTTRPGFNGIIYDVGGPTANMYASGCARATPCSGKHCLFPQPCANLKFGHATQMSLLRDIMKVPGIKKVFVSSGIRHDMVVADREHGERYIDQLAEFHVSGQIKLAPEHYDNDVLHLMSKPSIKPLMRFKALFDEACRRKGKKYFLTYYLMAAHPGCTVRHMERLQDFLSGGLHIIPEQVQIFTPTPSTISTAMYYCETDLEGKPLPCEKRPEGKQRQKDILRSVRSTRPHFHVSKTHHRNKRPSR